MTSEFGGAAGQFGTAYDRRAADYASAIEPTFRPAHRRRPTGGMTHGRHP